MEVLGFSLCCRLLMFYCHRRSRVDRVSKEILNKDLAQV